MYKVTCMSLILQQPSATICGVSFNLNPMDFNHILIKLMSIFSFMVGKRSPHKKKFKKTHTHNQDTQKHMES